MAIVSPPHAVSVPYCPSDTFTAIIPLNLGRRWGSEHSDCAEEETEVQKGNTARELPPVAHTYGNVAPGPAVFFFTTLPTVVMASWLSNPDYKTLGCSFWSQCQQWGWTSARTRLSVWDPPTGYPQILLPVSWHKSPTRAGARARRERQQGTNLRRCSLSGSRNYLVMRIKWNKVFRNRTWHTDSAIKPFTIVNTSSSTSRSSVERISVSSCVN